MRKSIITTVVIGVAAIGSVLILSAGNGNDDNLGSASDIIPNGKGHLPKDNGNGQANRNRTNSANIAYHGGPVILGTTNVHYIWYGNWGANTAQTILTTFAQYIGGSPYFNINTTYSNGSGAHVTNSVQYAGSVIASYTHGTQLSDAAIQAIVAETNPTDTNGIYFVLTSAEVTATSGFCTQYCGWHTHAAINGRDIKYSFVGNPDRCPNSCEWQTLKSPNNNPGADGMASIIAHELEESVTDPDLNAWYDSRGQENADKCAWTFGTTTASNGSVYNMTLGGLNFLIQRNWVAASPQGCALQYP